MFIWGILRCDPVWNIELLFIILNHYWSDQRYLTSSLNGKSCDVLSQNTTNILLPYNILYNRLVSTSMKTCYCVIIIIFIMEKQAHYVSMLSLNWLNTKY